MARFSLQETPNRPGVYIFRNATGEVIYVDGGVTAGRPGLTHTILPSHICAKEIPPGGRGGIGPSPDHSPHALAKFLKLRS